MRRNRPISVLPAAVLATACGYAFGTGLEQHGIRTIALEVVTNETYRQRLEVELNSFLARELPVTTDLMLADRRRADAVLQVVLLTAPERTIVPGTTGDPVREGALEGTVRMRLVGRDGIVRIDRQILDRTEFRSPIGENLTTARAELAEDLARKIALALEAGF